MPRTALQVDAAIRTMLDVSGGIVGAAEFRAAGIGRDVLRRRLAEGALQEPFPGVFAVVSELLDEPTRRRAAVLSCGAGAALTGWTAAEHLRLVTFQERPDDLIHVVVPAARRPRRVGTGIRVVRSELLVPEDIAVHDEIACLRLCPLLHSFTARHAPRVIERLLDEAAFVGLWKPWEMAEYLDRVADRRGAFALAEIVERHAPGTTRTTNELEETFLRICDAEGWPRPICQQPERLTDGRRIKHDFLWPRLRFSVETDGERGHAGPRRRARDASRDRLLARRGHETVRVTRDEVFRRRRVVVDRVGPRLYAALCRADGGRQLARPAS